jgi:hypothetical protein
MSIALNTVTFLNGVTAAGPSPVFVLDWNYHEVQQRSLIVACVSGDTINVEVSVDGGVTYGLYTALAGPQASTVTNIIGPFTHMRVTKVGSAGVSTVRGII